MSFSQSGMNSAPSRGRARRSTAKGRGNNGRGSTGRGTNRAPGHNNSLKTPSEKKEERLSTKRFDHAKKGDPFAKKGKSAFASAYSSGIIPCHLEHGSVRHKLLWTRHFDELHYDPLLVHCFEGLCDTQHPYVFVARTAIKDLLTAQDASRKTIPLVSKLIIPVRQALLRKEADVFDATLEAIGHLSYAVGPHLNAHLNVLLIQVNKKAFTNKVHREKIENLLRILEENGGPEALKLIKIKVPTYVSIS